VGRGLLTEILITFVLVFVVGLVASDPRVPSAQVASIAVGFALAAGVFVGGPVTGGGVNPARALGPMIVSGQLDDFWLYIVGPLIGGVLGAQRVFWIVDNGSSHCGQASIDRLQGDWPNLILVHLPYHASWLNQIEIYFSILARKALTPTHFRDLAELEQRILGFQGEFEQHAQPFDWRFTRRDLDALLAGSTTPHSSPALPERTNGQDY
jgi:hypothetical protein